MSIEQLKKKLESERLDTSKQYGLDMFPVQNIQTTKEFTQDVNFARRMTHSEAYKSGHEAATNRLLPLLEKAVEMADEIAAKSDMTIYNHSEEFMDGANAANIQCAEIAREFLLSLSETAESVSGFTKMTEIKKEIVE